MGEVSSVIEKIFSVNNEQEFNQLALEIFRFQAQNNVVYKEYLDLLGVDCNDIVTIQDIPFLPITFFKDRDVVSSGSVPMITFTSSSTTGMVPARHNVIDLSVYQRSFFDAFKLFYGDISEYAVLALLPSYLEREGSSLVYMADKLIQATNNPISGFYLYNYDELYNNLLKLKNEGKKVLLLGVSFALLDFAEKFSLDFPSLIVMETGGMKGRKEEIDRADLHSILNKCFGTDKIHSEYGMAELLSQAYSFGDGKFLTPPWMKILIRNLEDPFSYYSLPNKRGGINIIDLANIYSCSFIETEDLGYICDDSTFVILGRIKDSQRRGCNMLIE